ncbi:MAG: hypothetical protein AAF804_12060 [Bacteroidota bacterium]
MAGQKTDKKWLDLTKPQVRKIIEQNRQEDPANFALRHFENDFPYAVVATQLKYLAKAGKKLPEYASFDAIMPPLAYEQASSEASARMKELQGNRLLDLTMGLGVDTRHFARSFAKITALEQDETLARINGHNFRLFGVSNVEIIPTSAEEFLSSYPGPPFDWIYADPARRSHSGQRIHELAAGRPNLITLLPEIKRVGRRLLVKASPLLDLHAAVKLLPGVRRLHVHSIDLEVKEVLIEVDLERLEYSPLQEVALRIKCLQAGHMRTCELPLLHSGQPPPSQLLVSPVYLCEPDPAFYKLAHLGPLGERYFQAGTHELSHPKGYFLSTKMPVNWPGRTFRLIEQFPFKPKTLKKALAQRKLNQLHVMRRNFPLNVAQLRQQLRLKEGGQLYLICTTWRGAKVAWLGERV